MTSSPRQTERRGAAFLRVFFLTEAFLVDLPEVFLVDLPEDFLAGLRLGLVTAVFGLGAARA